MRHRVIVGIAVALAAAVVGARGPSWAGSGKDKDKKDKGPHLRYAATYAEAVAEGKARNTLVYAIFHKDH